MPLASSVSLVSNGVRAAWPARRSAAAKGDATARPMPEAAPLIRTMRRLDTYADMPRASRSRFGQFKNFYNNTSPIDQS
ncbi:MAG: hypothetical protein AB7S92_15490 [Parvibaculaceae bacterium]